MDFQEYSANLEHEVSQYRSLPIITHKEIPTYDIIRIQHFYSVSIRLNPDDVIHGNSLGVIKSQQKSLKYIPMQAQELS